MEELTFKYYRSDKRLDISTKNKINNEFLIKLGIFINENNLEYGAIFANKIEVKNFRLVEDFVAFIDFLEVFSYKMELL